MKRFEFICKGKRSHFLEADTEEAARSFFAENRTTATLEIIDVIEVPMPTPIDTSGITMKLEGFERINSEPKPSAAEIAGPANAERIGY
ncbi:hypothetical protein EBU71_00465 [bacterium]|nr:hypothetical protein [Candidatus Elulimicrobium humile]